VVWFGSYLRISLGSRLGSLRVKPWLALYLGVLGLRLA